MLFLTDSAENRRQRETMGATIKAVGIIEPTDWVVNIHVSGYLYRYWVPGFLPQSIADHVT